MASKKQSKSGEGLGLITDFLNGVREGVKRAGGSDEQMDKLRDKALIAAVVAMIVSPVRTALNFLDCSVSVTMNLACNMAQLIADAKLDWVNSDIAKYFSLPPAEGVRTSEVLLLHYNKYMTSDQVLADMDSQNLRPITLLELLWLAIQHPNLQLDFPIVALGAVVQVYGDRRVACLGRSDRGRDLGLCWFGSGWYEICRFAAVSK